MPEEEKAGMPFSWAAAPEAARKIIAANREAGAREEREAVARWLNANGSILAQHRHRTDSELIRWIASQIEAGEHRKP